MRLSRNGFEQVLKGASIYSTGGGLEMGMQAKMLGSIKRMPEIVSIDELDGGDYACAAYGVGSTSVTNLDPGEPLKKGISILEGILGRRPAALFAGETNIEALVARAASSLGIPILDADSTGGRAVPEIQIDNFFVANKAILPLVAVNMDGEAVSVTNRKELPRIDSIIRKLATRSKSGSAAVLDHTIRISDAKRILTKGIFLRSYDTGKMASRLVGRSNSAELLRRYLKARLVINGTITRVSLRDSGGFLKGFYYVSDDNGNEARIFVKNENIACWLNGRLMVEPPDSIMTIDARRLIGVHNSKIKNGMHVSVMRKRATALWRTQKGRRIFGLGAFKKDLREVA